MTKVAKQNKAHADSSGKPVLYEQNMMIDDTIIPNAEELAKLKDVDPSLVQWVTSRCEQEQNFRHDFSRSQIGLAKKELNGNISLHWACLIMVFLLILGALGASVYMLIVGINVAGSIFAGGTVIGIIIAFSKLLPSRNKSQVK
jgi:uncharacterized membrane protein